MREGDVHMTVTLITIMQHLCASWSPLCTSCSPKAHS